MTTFYYFERTTNEEYKDERLSIEDLIPYIKVGDVNTVAELLNYENDYDVEIVVADLDGKFLKPDNTAVRIADVEAQGKVIYIDVEVL